MPRLVSLEEAMGGGAAAPSSFPSVSPAQQMAREGDRSRILQQELDDPQTSPADKAAVRAELQAVQERVDRGEPFGRRQIAGDIRRQSPAPAAAPTPPAPRLISLEEALGGSTQPPTKAPERPVNKAQMLDPWTAESEMYMQEGAKQWDLMAHHSIPANLIKAYKKGVFDQDLGLKQKITSAVKIALGLEPGEDVSINFGDLWAAARKDPVAFGGTLVDAIRADPEFLAFPMGLGGTLSKFGGAVAGKAGSAAAAAGRVAGRAVEIGAVGAVVGAEQNIAEQLAEREDVSPNELAASMRIGAATAAALGVGLHLAGDLSGKANAATLLKRVKQKVEAGAEPPKAMQEALDESGVKGATADAAVEKTEAEWKREQGEQKKRVDALVVKPKGLEAIFEKKKGKAPKSTDDAGIVMQLLKQKIAQEEAAARGSGEAQKAAEIDAAYRQREIDTSGPRTVLEARDNLFTTIQASTALAEGIFTDLATGKEMAPPGQRTAMQGALENALSRQKGAMDRDLVKWLGLGTAAAALGSYSYTHPDDLKALVATGLLGGYMLGHKLPLITAIEKNVGRAYGEAVRAVNPEALGLGAKKAAAFLGEQFAKEEHRRLVVDRMGEERLKFWRRNEAKQLDFLMVSEHGPIADPILERMRQDYKSAYDFIAERDQAKGYTYTPLEHYVPHLFEDSKGVSNFMTQKYGRKWGDPSFIKERGYKLLSEALDAGFKLRTTNPEEMFQERLFASERAHLKAGILEQLEAEGLARLKPEKSTPETTMRPGEHDWRSPNGQMYYVQDAPWQILHNAFESVGLRERDDLIGMAFRGVMEIKNKLVPLKLLSLFHPIHIATISPGAELGRATISLGVGAIGAGEWFSRVGKVVGTLGAHTVATDISIGNRVMKVLEGKVENPTDAERAMLATVLEGGLIPHQSIEEIGSSLQQLQAARDGQKWLKTTALVVPATIELAGKYLLMGGFIPRIKVGSYLRDAVELMKRRPELNDPENSLERKMALRDLMKKSEARFGQMAYKQHFWDKVVKDVGVGSMLSLGWSLGFLHIYGGAAPTAIKGLAEAGIKGAAVAGKLDNAAFVLSYSAMTMMSAGLINYAFTGEMPEGLDYVAPRTGDFYPDGSPVRIGTPFYPLEFYKIMKHMEVEGGFAGVEQFALNKISFTHSMVKDMMTGVDGLGREIRDPSAPAFQQLAQTLGYELSGLTPMALDTVRRSGLDSAKAYTLAAAGFGPAPKYITAGKVEGQIASEYQRTHGTKITTKDQAEKSKLAREMRQARDKGDEDTYLDKRDQLQTKFNLTEKQVSNLEKGSDLGASERMFKRLTTKEQLGLLRKMPGEAQAEYLPLATKRAQDLFLSEGEVE